VKRGEAEKQKNKEAEIFGGEFKMLNKKLFFLILCLGWTATVFAMGQTPEKPKTSGSGAPQQTATEKGPMHGKTFGEYVSQKEEETPKREEGENELLAPVAKPVAAVIEGVGSAVEPLLEEKEIKDEKGETQATIKPKEGKVQVDF